MKFISGIQKINWLKIMRFSGTQLILILVFAGMSYARPGNAQINMEQRVNLNMHDATIASVLHRLEKLTDVKFVYSLNRVNVNRRIDVDVTNARLDSILEDVLIKNGIGYEVVSNRVVLTPGITNRTASLTGLMQAHDLHVQLQDVEVRGKVTDENGSPLAGVTLQVKGTNIGTTTDNQGNYVIHPLSANDTLVFSFIGYERQEIPIAGRSQINIQMHATATGLNQVVVVGYGTQRKVDLTGAISVINSNDIKDIPVGNASYIMQGKASGVAITEQTGAPGDYIAVRIRGVGTINNNDPLYIIDGVPTTNGINNISPDDIESINILKDAASAAIYGARASNGVVIITTKHGQAGKTKINFSDYTGVQARGHLIKMANTKEYVNAFNIAAKADGRQPIPLDMLDTLPDINWLKEILKPALISNTHLSISGGNEKNQYIISGTYFKQDGLITNSSYERFNIFSSLTLNPYKWITIGTNMNLAYSKTRQVGSSGDGYGVGNPGASVVRYALFRVPATPVYNSQGQFVDLPNPPTFFGDGYNPVAFAKSFDRSFNDYTTLGDAYLEFHPFEGFTLKTDVGTNLGINFYRQFFPTWGIDRHINSPNSLAQSVNNEFNYNFTNTLSYIFNLKKRHVFKILVGSEAIKDDIKTMSASRTNFVDQSPEFQYLDNGLANQLNGGNESHWGLFSLLGRIEYAYKDKFLLNFNMRRDGSSRLSLKNRWGNFYSGSAAWRLDKENFIKKIKQISLLKLRFSLGQLGNQNIGNYPYASLISGGFYYPFGGIPTEGYTITSKGNPEVKWETSTQTDIGLETGFYNNTLQLTIDYFIKNTSNMLLSIPEPSSAGASASSPTENAGKVKNNGLELQLSYQGNIGTKFKYDLSANFATLHNEVISLAGGKPIPGGRIDNNYYATLTAVGHPIGAFYLLVDDCIFQTPIDVITSAYQGPNIQPGDVKFKDLNNDGVVDQNDRTFVGSPIPKLTYGFTLSAVYKNFDLSIFLQGVYGNKIYNQVLTDIEGFYRPFNITKRIATKSWHGPGTSNTFPRLSWKGAINNKQPSTRFLEDGSYLRLKNIQIGYTLGNNITSKLKISSIRIFLSVQNLLTFTKYTGLDPEQYISNNALNDGDRAVGIDWGTYPSARTFTAGININF
ncbi:TonB-linked SusC/RagA family outer membrane protein [Thermoflavifilum aggregans]|uniref:TonB-linked SusC/RagA family outer membrane protein n=1 Tax=Thermoflavifilum aggregans TaxID=454188 RepID=A0A2M9CV84_9BACT|nr:TonB-dependent receptor [Thermoflavifilum aggregans]PJJ75822.1 TonB-linked SusC/RagA family outer membrane protein [Thermoflavifilum aggregans]